ncbi:MAG: hypothetical protein AB7I19_11790 [Planctomycetota bacterium]
MSLQSTCLRTAVTLLATLPPLMAQATMTLRGELDEGRSTGCYYCPNVPYTIKFSETPVRSTVVDLEPYHLASQQLLLTGTWDTSTRPAGFHVTAAQVVAESLGFPTNARTGASERFDVQGPAGSPSTTFLAYGSGFVPVFDTALLLNPAVLIEIDSGVIGPQGGRRFLLSIPADPALAGLNFWTQSILVPPTGSPYFSNPGRTTIDR